METTLLFLAACLMFSGVHSESQSMSCSTVNGKTICNKQTSDGNSAMASSQARFGGGSSSQRTYAGAGSSDNWDSSSQTLNGGAPAQGSGYAGSVPVPSNPFDFVRGFMGGGGPAAGAFAGAGFFPLGRR